MKLTKKQERILYALACGDHLYFTFMGKFRLFELGEEVSRRDFAALLSTGLIKPTRWWLSTKGWRKAPANVAELGHGHPEGLKRNMKGAMLERYGRRSSKKAKAKS